MADVLSETDLDNGPIDGEGARIVGLPIVKLPTKYALCVKLSSKVVMGESSVGDYDV